MAEESNDDGGDPASDIKKQNDDSGGEHDPKKAEHLSHLSSEDQDEAEE